MSNVKEIRSYLITALTGYGFDNSENLKNFTFVSANELKQYRVTLSPQKYTLSFQITDPTTLGFSEKTEIPFVDIMNGFIKELTLDSPLHTKILEINRINSDWPENL